MANTAELEGEREDPPRGFQLTQQTTQSCSRVHHTYSREANGWTDGHEADSIGVISKRVNPITRTPNDQIYCPDGGLTEGRVALAEKRWQRSSRSLSLGKGPGVSGPFSSFKFCCCFCCCTANSPTERREIEHRDISSSGARRPLGSSYGEKTVSRRCAHPIIKPLTTTFPRVPLGLPGGDISALWPTTLSRHMTSVLEQTDNITS